MSTDDRQSSCRGWSRPVRGMARVAVLVLSVSSLASIAAPTCLSRTWTAPSWAVSPFSSSSKMRRRANGPAMNPKLMASMALCTLALLKSGVGLNDPAVEKRSATFAAAPI